MPIRHVRWTPHARDRLQDRPEVSQRMVEDALLHPDDDEPAPTPSSPDRRVAQKLLEMGRRQYLLRVFYDPRPNDTAAVVSFYRTSQISRYQRGTP